MMHVEDYRHLATALAKAIEAAMWSTEFTEQVNVLSAVQDALEHQGKDLPLPDAARVRLEVLQTLKQADEYADDPRAKEFGTLFCLLETMTSQERTRLATLLIQLLRFVSGKAELDGAATPGSQRPSR